MSGRKYTARRFTLIEMLVVITIIAILAAMLSPALMRALDVANNVGCVNNLRQVYVASFAYTSEYNNYLTKSQAGSGVRWQYALWPYIADNEDITFGKMMANAPWKGTPLCCPSIRYPDGFPGDGYDFTYSYSQNDFFNTTAKVVTGSIEPTVQKKITSIKKPSKTAYYLDNPGYTNSTCYRTYLAALLNDLAVVNAGASSLLNTGIRKKYLEYRHLDGLSVNIAFIAGNIQSYSGNDFNLDGYNYTFWTGR